MGSPSQFTNNELEDYAIETFGFILAYLCFVDGISIVEAGKCNACFTALIFGNDKERFFQVAKTIEFYYKILILNKEPKQVFFRNSIILYNLKRPKTWNNFNERIPIEHMDFFEVTEGCLKLNDFLNEYLIKEINPILAKMN